MIIPTDDGLVIIDFKTDGVSADFAEQRAKYYDGQIRYYTAAASAILGEKVAASYLYFLKPSLAVKMAY
jgi:ATP-dependent exoDNAse (exonuclease V) beta subunit